MNEPISASTANSHSDFTRAETLVVQLSEKLAASANTRTVYGDPVHSHGRTVIPVAKIGYGVGATSGGRSDEHVGGGAGGGGIGCLPMGYIEISDGQTRYVDISISKKMLVAVGLAAVAGFLLGRFSR